jgi:hypothetical protein
VSATTRGPRRQVAWCIIRERDGRVGYFAGHVVRRLGCWQPDADHALRFLSRRQAADEWRTYFGPRCADVRIVPVFL